MSITLCQITHDRGRIVPLRAALRAESPNIDMIPQKGVGGTEDHEEGNRIVTGDDIMRQLAGAFVERN